jgi:hypothetical protein
MKSMRIAAFAAAFAVLPLAAYARGAGGFTWGQQIADSQLANFDLQSSLTGVYGYGVSWNGRRTGGFALAVHSDGAAPAVEGGFIGGIAGQEFRRSPFIGAVNLWAGLGGLSAGRGISADGSFAVFGEITAELGVAFMPGVLLTGYAGLQAMSAVSSGETFFTRVMYSPVIGMRLAWGS